MWIRWSWGDSVLSCFFHVSEAQLLQSKKTADSGNRMIMAEEGLRWLNRTPVFLFWEFNAIVGSKEKLWHRQGHVQVRLTLSGSGHSILCKIWWVWQNKWFLFSICSVESLCPKEICYGLLWGQRWWIGEQRSRPSIFLHHTPNFSIQPEVLTLLWEKKNLFNV